jgi:Protein of unknown function (DUF2946)
VGIFTRGKRGLLPRRIIVWIAAYALAFQSVIAPLIAHPLNSLSFDGSSPFEHCFSGNAAVPPGTGGIPADRHDDNVPCKLCIHGGFLVAPPIAAAWAVPAIGASIRWAVIDNPVPDAPGFIGKSRGPPLLT